MSPKNACYQCPDRTMTCHSTCEKYKEFTEEQKQRKEAVLSGRTKYNIGMGYEINRVEKIKKKRGK